VAVFLCLVLIVSGAIEMFYYIPSVDQAAQSIQVITYHVPYGAFVRNLHYWSAQLLLLVIAIHLLRVVFTGAYARPRAFNYLLGLGLLLLCLFLDFTGYILRWDEGIRWALVAGTNLVRTAPIIGPALYGIIVGGSQPGPATLVRFYAWHIFGLSLPLVLVGGWHLFRIRRDGGIALPPPELRQDHRRINRYELVRREALAAIVCGILLVLVSTFFPAPIAAPIGDGALHAPDGRAPWFFLWVQQLLRLGNPFVWGVVVPLVVLLWLGILPYWLPAAQPGQLGAWFPRGNRLARYSVALLALAILGLTLLGLR
jgi:quinol-cytochrome oxidoreductase complex cytochrome b subunit